MIDLPPDTALVADTPCLRLMPATIEDAAELRELYTEPEVARWSEVDVPTVEEVEDQLRLEVGRRTADGLEVVIRWVARLVPLGELVGEVVVQCADDGRARLAVAQHSRYGGHGFALEAIQAALSLLETHLQSTVVEADVPVGNAAAEALARRLRLSPAEAVPPRRRRWRGQLSTAQSALAAAVVDRVR